MSQTEQMHQEEGRALVWQKSRTFGVPRDARQFTLSLARLLRDCETLISSKSYNKVNGKLLEKDRFAT